MSPAPRAELRWRRIKRRGGADLLAALFEAADVRHAALHFADAKSFEGAVLKFLKGLRADIYVFDEGLINPRLIPRAVARASHKVPRLQLADLTAGFYADEECRRPASASSR